MNLLNPLKIKIASRILIIAWLAGTIWGFWWFQLRHYQVDTNQTNNLPDPALLLSNLPLNDESKEALVVHFFDPGCICSRFNEAHTRSIIKQYSDQGVTFKIAVPNTSYLQEAEQIFGVPAFVSHAAPEKLSSPLALVLNTSHKPVYLGSYSDTAFCTAEDG